MSKIASKKRAQSTVVVCPIVYGKTCSVFIFASGSADFVHIPKTL